jgi:SAM-dependent methyltransferase
VAQHLPISCLRCLIDNNVFANASNLGAGKTYIPGFINVDISKAADLSLDLGKDNLPFEDNSIDLIFSYHTLEHVSDYLFALNEIYRVLKHGGVFLVGLPYATLTEYHLVNPYHRHNFNEHSFAFFNPDRLKGSAAETNEIAFGKFFHRFHYMGCFHLVPVPFRTWCRRHLFNVVRKVDFGLFAVKHQGDLQVVNQKPANELKKLFDECLKSRIPYDEPTQAQKRTGLFQLMRKLLIWWRGGGLA